MKASFLRNVLVVTATSTAFLSGGCISYQAKPLPQLQYNDTMNSRSAADADVSTTSITLPEAEWVALCLNPRLRAAREVANVGFVGPDHAGMWDDPVLSGDVLRLLENKSARWIVGGALLFSIPISGRLHVEKEQSRAESKAAILKAWGEEQMVIRELRESWAEWSAARGARDVYTNEQARYSNASGYADARVRDGSFASSDASLLRVSRSRGALEESRLASAEERAHLRILSLMGLSNTPNIALVASPTIADWTGNPDDIYRLNPQVLLSEAEYEVAEQNLRLEVRKQFPDVSLGPAFEQRNGHDALGLGFSMPIPILNGNRGNIARRAAERDAARVAWEASVEEAFASYTVAQSEREMARRRIDGLRVVIPSTESQVNESRTRLESSDRNTLLLVDSVGNERDTKLALLDADIAEARHNAALWALIPYEAPYVHRGDHPSFGEGTDTTESDYIDSEQ